MEGDRPGEAGNHDGDEQIGDPVDPGASPAAGDELIPRSDPEGTTEPLGMGPPAGVPGGYGVTSETIVEQRGWFSGARLTALITAVVLVIAGTAVAVVLSGGGSSQLEEIVPAGALAFGEANLLASGEQQDAVRSLVERFPIPQGQEPGEAFERFLDEGLAEEGFSFEQDFKPWLGTQIGFVVTGLSLSGGAPMPQWAFLATVRDEGRAKATLDRIKQTEDSMAYAIREGVAFVAPDLLSLELSLGAVDGKKGPLSEDSGFTSIVDRVGDDNLAVVYLDGEQLQSLIPPGSLPAFPGIPDSSGRQVIALRAEENALVLRGFSTSAGPGAVGTPALVEAAPDAILGALTLFDPATLFEQGIEFAGLFLFGFQEGFGGGFDESVQLSGRQIPDARSALDDFLRETLGLTLDGDILPWLHGELSVVVGRLSLLQPEIGVLIESTDDAAAGRTIDGLRDNLGRLASGAGFEVTSAPGGFAILIPDAGTTVIVRRVAGKVVIASSDTYADQLLAASPQSLAEDAVYRRAVGDPGVGGVSFQMFVRIDRLASFLQVLVPAGEYAEAEQYFAPLESLGVRATNTDDGSSFRMVLTFK